MSKTNNLKPIPMSQEQQIQEKNIQLYKIPITKTFIFYLLPKQTIKIGNYKNQNYIIMQIKGHYYITNESLIQNTN